VASLHVTVPVPLPVVLTERSFDPRVNVAVTLFAAVTFRAQVSPREESQPAQLTVEPPAGAAVNVTAVP
jgi:hypothetical protein